MKQTDLFAGTASFYARFRPHYSDQLLKRIGDEVDIEHRGGTLLDLGCGTGQLAIPLSMFFTKVFAVDPDADMLKEGDLQAKVKEVPQNSIHWMKASSHDLEKLLREISSLSAVTMGRSFHWMEREKVLDLLYSHIEPLGRVFLVGEESKSIQPKNWVDIAQKVITHYLGDVRRAGTRGTFAHPTKKHQEVVADSAFGDPELVYFETVREWTVDSVVGFLYSTSYCSLPVIGKHKEAFESELRERLAEVSEDGVFQEVVCEELIIAKKR